MALGFFCNKYILPSEDEVTGVLGETAVLWKKLRSSLEQYGSVKEEWKIYSQKAGWCKKLLLVSGKEERNIIFLYPNEEYFTGVLVFGEYAVKAAEDSEVPADILNKILEAKPYKEGRSFNIEVRDTGDFDILNKLITIKIQN
jgi:hypothetical protein